MPIFAESLITGLWLDTGKRLGPPGLLNRQLTWPTQLSFRRIELLRPRPGFACPRTSRHRGARGPRAGGGASAACGPTRAANLLLCLQQRPQHNGSSEAELEVGGGRLFPSVRSLHCAYAGSGKVSRGRAVSTVPLPHLNERPPISTSLSIMPSACKVCHRKCEMQEKYWCSEPPFRHLPPQHSLKTTIESNFQIDSSSQLMDSNHNITRIAHCASVLPLHHKASIKSNFLISLTSWEINLKMTSQNTNIDAVTETRNCLDKGLTNLPSWKGKHTFNWNRN